MDVTTADPIDVWAPDEGEHAGYVWLAGERLTPSRARDLARRLTEADAEEEGEE